MAYPGGTRPMNLQVHKSHAEFKALRLNRTEQCRLKSAQSFITREERNYHKDFRSSRTQVENNFLRHFSVQQDSAPSSPVPWSATPTPRRMSVLSSRRISQIPPTSVRRSSVWSLPDSAVKSRLLQQRRQTYGEASARSPQVCRPDTARMSHITDTEHAAGSDVYIRISSGTESCRSCGLGDHRSKHSPDHYPRKEAYQEKSECCCVRHDVNVGNDHAEIVGHCSECPDIVRSRTPLDRIDETLPPDTLCTTMTKPNRKPRILTANISRPNLNSRPTTPVTDDLHRHNNRSRSASLVSSSRFNALKIQDSPASKNSWMSGSESEQPETESGKCERKVGILLPPARHGPILLQTPAVSDTQPPPNPSEETQVPLQAELCSAEDHTDSFPQTVTFTDFQTDLESDEQTELQDRVANFLHEQNSFNRRFPLEKCENDKFESVKARVMQNKSSRYSPQTTRSELKQRMIDEVLEKLGMAKQDSGARTNFPVL